MRGYLGVGPVDKSCKGKKSFGSYEEAGHIAYKHISPSSYISPYLCTYCGKWHNGHLPLELRKKLHKR